MRRHTSGTTAKIGPPSGGQYGPASVDVLKQWIDEGRVAATALLWREGWPQWRDAGEALPELAARLPSGGIALRSPPVGSLAHDAEARRAQLSGQAGAGSERRVRSMRRALWVGILTLVAATLVGVLVVVANRSGG